MIRMSSPWRRAPRGGFTLMELLVTIFILVAITVIALGVTAPDTEQRRLREAARQVEIFLHQARAEAQEQGRPVGVMLVPYRPAPSAAVAPYALQLHMVELPEPYIAGSPANPVRVVQVQTNPPPGQAASFVLAIPDVGWQGLIRVGDLVQLNQQGPWYQLLGAVDSNGSLRVDAKGFLLEPLWVVRMSWSGSSDVLGPVRQFPYRPGDALPQGIQVLRFPRIDAQSFSPNEPLELPQGTVIDLRDSRITWPNGGLGPTLNHPAGVFVGFSAQGEVFVLHPGYSSVLQGNVFLLVGLVERAADRTNLREPGTYWVGINHRTGQVMTAVNAGSATGNFLAATQYIRSWDSEGGN